MTTLVNVVSTAVSNGLRSIKAVFGKTNVKEVNEVAPHGIDSNPPKNRIAAQSITTVKGVNVIYGYYNTLQAADTGETYIYSTNSAGTSIAIRFKLKNDGNAELGGNADNLVRYAALNTALQNDIKTFINVQLPLIAAGIATGGGSYTPGTMTIDISGSKVNNLKCS